ncbi:UDP-N-acetylenolpyruvoylglucosamine reductase [Clostridium sp. MCC353]|uniref:UDP-N-acetylenolpyruvoylglucosamine reductase n=1 Tax=Clostridium sp. MCC353 TaxID=2592646 RepID=UPI001C020410|nr:UDP-N-acetylenolpyruvoylglucosamine reductase [Clostridium sp. MCC353]MBT9776877.1 UDP-N-acetylenolpyruvoylglucosamine reductase [Clostridium sp. MCC353]
MTVIKEQAIELIKRLPDDKVFYVVSILEGLEGLYSEREEIRLTDSQKAYQSLQNLRKKGTAELDYKAELIQALEEKYESLG